MRRHRAHAPDAGTGRDRTQAPGLSGADIEHGHHVPAVPGITAAAGTAVRGLRRRHFAVVVEPPEAAKTAGVRAASGVGMPDTVARRSIT
jgi:hypothetical protein